MSNKPTTLILLRHGQSEWNKANKFTGWTDVDLTEQGREEAKKAGQILKQADYQLDRVYSNSLKRAIKTAWIVMEEMDQMSVPFETTWRLNEKHYGVLQGLNKAKTLEREGEEKVLQWRRGFDSPPPTLELSDPRHPIHDPKYRDVPKEELPGTESLKDTIDRMLPFWHDEIWPELNDKETVMVSASHNSLRGLVQHLSRIPKEVISYVNIPYGIPLIYEFDKNMHVMNHYYLGNPEQIAASLHEIKSQGHAKDKDAEFEPEIH